MPQPSAATPIDVAVGVVTRADGQVLLAERPAGKPWAGYWEFPGGKFEAGENPVQALARELHEELGVELDTAYPWITREYTYPDRAVRLHLYRVLRWHGDPHGREGQRLSWENPARVGTEPLLPANHDILQALNLPSIYAITNASKLGVEVFMQRLEKALERGVRLLQVREKNLSGSGLQAFTRAVVDLGHQAGARVLVNSDLELARMTDADGVHLQTNQFMKLSEPPAVGLWAASCHNRQELLKAAALGANFAVLSPVLPTRSHPGTTALGWDQFRELCIDLPMPVYALGGMKADMQASAMSYGGHGIALLSGIW